MDNKVFFVHIKSSSHDHNNKLQVMNQIISYLKTGHQLLNKLFPTAPSYNYITSHKSSEKIILNPLSTA